MHADYDSRKTAFIGLISDTHGYLDSVVIEVFAGTDLIIHAGDIGIPEILQALSAVAPVKAVRGNMDHGPWSSTLPETEIVEAGEVLLYVLHDRQRLDLDPSAAGFGAVISGHSHRPLIEKRNGILYLNPGSASQPRFHHPATVALLTIADETADARIIEL